MEQANHLKRIQETRAAVDSIRELLIDARPGALDGCAPFLEELITGLKNLEPELANVVNAVDRRELNDELSRLRQDVSGIEDLMRNASKFYLGWAKLLSETNSGYTADGEARTWAIPPPRLTVEA